MAFSPLHRCPPGYAPNRVALTRMRAVEISLDNQPHFCRCHPRLHGLLGRFTRILHSRSNILTHCPYQTPFSLLFRTATRHLTHSKSSLARWTRSVAALPSTLHSNSGGSLGRALRRFRPGVRTLRLRSLALKSFLRLTPGWLSSQVEKVPARILGIFFK